MREQIEAGLASTAVLGTLFLVATVALLVTVLTIVLRSDWKFRQGPFRWRS